MSDPRPQRQARTKHRILRRVLLALAAIIIAAALALHIYASDYYRATDEAWQAEQSDAAVSVTAIESDVAFIPADAAQQGKVVAALVFYPGGKVEADAYAPLLERLAERGIACVLARMPENLAVLAPSSADHARAELEGALRDAGADPDGIPWMIGGHSLGGAMAASYVAKHADSYQGLALLAAYSTADLAQTGLHVLTLVGSNDGVVNRDSLSADAANLPEGWREQTTIEGGIHSYFGCYGIQDGDGQPEITNDQQLDQAADAIASLAAGLDARS